MTARRDSPDNIYHHDCRGLGAADLVTRLCLDRESPVTPWQAATAAAGAVAVTVVISAVIAKQRPGRRA